MDSFNKLAFAHESELGRQNGCAYEGRLNDKGVFKNKI